MKFDLAKMREVLKAFRTSWSSGHYLTYDKGRDEVMEHKAGEVAIWYWTTPDDFVRASEDLTANDWIFEKEGEERC